MKQYILLDAIGCMDADLVAEHIRMKNNFAAAEVVRKPRNIKRMSVIAACAALILVIGLCFPLVSNLVGNGDDTIDPDGEVVGGTETEDTTPPEESWPVYVPPEFSEDTGGGLAFPIWQVYQSYPYNYWECSMALVEIDNVIGIYKNERYGDSYSILVECRLVKDYYKRLSKEKFTLGIPLEMSENEMIELINENDQFIIYSRIRDDSVSFYTETDERILIDSLGYVSLMEHQFIPVKDGRINSEPMYEKLSEYSGEEITPYNIGGYSSFILQDMPMDAVEKNIEILYEWCLVNDEMNISCRPSGY